MARTIVCLQLFHYRVRGLLSINIRFWDIFVTFVGDMNKLSKQRIHSKRYKSFCEVLKLEREKRSFKQKALADMLGIKQSFISKTEKGDRRLDIIELLEYCEAMGISFTDFAFRLESKFFCQNLLSSQMKQSHLKWLDLYKKYHNMD